MRAWMAVFALTGCQTLFGVVDDPDRLAPDAAAPDTGVIVNECWGTDINVCVRPPPTAARTLSGTLDTGSMCDVVEDDLCIVAGTDVTIENLRATGPRPLVVIAGGKLTVTGMLDAASHRAGTTGPGVGAAACVLGPAPTYAPSGTGSGGGGGGGAGGTFLHSGGQGGASVANAQIGMPTVGIGAAFRAGCQGQNGGLKTGSTLLAPGGSGGGAVYLIAGTSIEITGAINASGAAGDGGKCVCAATTSTTDLQNAESYGGAGGGSGGAIILEAPAIAIKAGAFVFADGGGGGQGASRSQPGTVGAEPAGDLAALGGLGMDDGGPGPSNGGNGGRGSHAEIRYGTLGANGKSSNIGGGGGGGGGDGHIKLIGAVTRLGTVSPSLDQSKHLNGSVHFLGFSTTTFTPSSVQ